MLQPENIIKTNQLTSLFSSETLPHYPTLNKGYQSISCQIENKKSNTEIHSSKSPAKGSISTTSVDCGKWFLCAPRKLDVLPFT
jgi:hypothetical protein